MIIFTIPRLIVGTFPTPKTAILDRSRQTPHEKDVISAIERFDGPRPGSLPYPASPKESTNLGENKCNSKKRNFWRFWQR